MTASLMFLGHRNLHETCSSKIYFANDRIVEHREPPADPHEALLGGEHIDSFSGAMYPIPENAISQ
jgi:hypothetical protein